MLLAPHAPEDATADTFRWDPQAADRVVNFIERALTHTKGRHARKPFLLADWQKNQIVRPLFGTMAYDGQYDEWVRQYRVAWLEMARKNGKALDVATPILTARGWSTMGELVSGDYVHAADGSLTRVRWVSGRQNRPCFRITFADGAEIVAADNHLWTVLDQKAQTTRTIDTNELFENQAYGGRGDRRFGVDVPGALERPRAVLPVNPYLLGCWLGDGTSARGEMTSADPEIFEAFENAGYALSYDYDRGVAHVRGIPGLMAQLRSLGVLNNKHVPAEYLTASSVQRMALLRGLMDTDGGVNLGPNTPRVEFCSTTKALADAVLFLARSLGWKATIKESRTSLDGRDCGPRWRVCWTAYRGYSPFALARKTDSLAPHPGRRTRTMTNKIVSVEPVETVEAVCIAVEHESHMFLAGTSLTPTHNSELASGLALYGLVADGEESAEVYSVAADRDQASLVFDVAKRMVELSPVLSKRLTIVASKKRIIDPSTNSFYAVLPGDASGALGTNPSMVLFDEVLTQRDRHLWDAMRQGFGTRRQPILIATTTAAYTSARFALEEHEYGEGILGRPSADPSRFVFMRNTPRDWDWRDEGRPADPSTGEPATGWYHANPALGDFLSIGNLRSEAVEAESKPSAENSFRVFRLNQWVSQAERWLDMAVWDLNGVEPVDREALRGRSCYAGLDLASVSDFTAWVLIFPGSVDDPEAEGFTVLPRFWIPRKALKARGAQRQTLEYWRDLGYLTITDSDVTDYSVVREEIGKDAEDFHIDLFGYDPWNATHLVSELEDGGLEGVKAPQTSARMTDPCKWMESLLANTELRHGGNPVLRWMADNVEVQYTGDGLFKPSKSKSGDKIDGISALLNALFVAFTEEDSGLGFIGPDDDDDE